MMGEYKIEKNIPFPKVTRSKWSWLLELEVGDSVLIPEKRVASVRTSVGQIGKMNDMKFSVRTVENGKYRLWRVR